MRSRSRQQVLAVLTEDLVIRPHDHPGLRGCIRGMTQRGELRQLLPGVHVPVATSNDLATRLAALHAVDPTAVLAGPTAARLIGWQLRDDTVTAYRTGGPRVDRPGFRWLRGAVPPELIVTRNGRHRTCASLTVLDLVPMIGAVAVDEGLRRGVPLEAMHHALSLTPSRPGNPQRRQLLHDSRDLPWSPTERIGHQLLRRIGLTQWRTNVTVTCRNSFSATVDVLHGPSRTVIEFDGWEFHSSRDAFETDRWRDLELEADGWCVIRVTWRHLVNHADQVGELIRRVVANRLR